MRRGPEGKVQDKMTAFLRANEIIYKKKDAGPRTTSAGWPDLEIYPGDERVFFIEAKAPGKDFEPLQLHVATKLRRAGYTVYLVDDGDDGVRVIAKEIGLELTR